MSKLVWTWLVIGLVVFFAVFIKKFAWVFGLLMGMLSSGFNILNYFWVSCSVLWTFTYLLMMIWLFIVIVRVYKAFK